MFTLFVSIGLKRCLEFSGFNNKHFNVGHLFCLCIFGTVVDYMFAVNGGGVVRVQSNHESLLSKGNVEKIQQTCDLRVTVKNNEFSAMDSKSLVVI